MPNTPMNSAPLKRPNTKQAARWTRQGLLNLSLVVLMAGVVLGKQLLLKTTLLQAGGYGWVALPRPGTTGPDYADFDWTGQDVDRTVTKYDGTHEDLSSRLYGDWADNYPIEYTYDGTGGANGVAHGHLKISGASTYKWQWVPPNDTDTGLPDLVNFPAPPLFTLGRVQARVSATPVDPNNLVGLSASGSVTDGFGDGWAPQFDSTFPGMTPSAPADNLHRAIVPASSDDAQTASARLSPTVSLDVTGIEHTTDPATGYSVEAGKGHDVALLTKATYAIQLTAPDPMKRPDTLGDGGNQFVFGGGDDQLLKIPVAAVVTGGTEDEAKFLIKDPTSGTPHVDFKVNPQIASTISGTPFGYDLTATGNSISVQTRGSDISNHPWPAGFFIYEGLPHSFSTVADGNQKVILTVDGKDSTIAYIQTFFKGASNNHPDSDKDATGNNYNTPNWYHYYGKVYTSPGSFDINNPTTFSARTLYYPPYSIFFYTNTYADGAPVDVRVFDIGPAAPDHRQYIRWVGTLQAQGIHRYIYLCAHENGHKIIFTQQPGIYTVAQIDPTTGDYGD